MHKGIFVNPRPFSRKAARIPEIQAIFPVRPLSGIACPVLEPTDPTSPVTICTAVLLQSLSEKARHCRQQQALRARMQL